MPEPQIADHPALAVPGKIGGQFQEGHGFVTESLGGDAADHADLRFFLGEIRSTGKLEERRRVESRVREQLRETHRLQKAFRVECAPALKVSGSGFAAPSGAPGKIPGVIGPAALIDLERLVRPLAGEGKIRHLVIAAPEPVSLQGRFGMDGIEPGKVAGEFHLQRGRFAGKSEPAQFVRHSMNEKQALPPFFI